MKEIGEGYLKAEIYLNENSQNVRVNDEQKRL